MDCRLLWWLYIYVWWVLGIESSAGYKCNSCVYELKNARNYHEQQQQLCLQFLAWIHAKFLTLLTNSKGSAGQENFRRVSCLAIPKLEYIYTVFNIGIQKVHESIIYITWYAESNQGCNQNNVQTWEKNVTYIQTKKMLKFSHPAHHCNVSFQITLTQIMLGRCCWQWNRFKKDCRFLSDENSILYFSSI